MLVDMPDALEVAFLHVEPRVLLKPVCDFLESFDSSIETFGASTALASVRATTDPTANRRRAPNRALRGHRSVPSSCSLQVQRTSLPPFPLGRAPS